VVRVVNIRGRHRCAKAGSGSTVVSMNTTEQLAVREQDDVAAYRPIVEVAPITARSHQEQPAPAPTPRRTRPLAFLRWTLATISQAGQPAATPQAPLVWPNGAVTWTPYATDDGPH
jgi:hypothetical protein